MPVVEGSVSRSVWRSVQGSRVGKNLSRRGEVWRFRRALPEDLRERAGRAEVVRGLGRIPVGDALAEADRLNVQFNRAIAASRLDPAFDLIGALANLRRAEAVVVATSATRFEAFPHSCAQQSLQRPEPESPLLSEAVDHYEREQWAAGRWKAEKAGHAAMAELRRFADFVGELPLREITREEVRAFRDHRGETLRASTLNIKVMSRLVSFFRHCQEEGWGTKLPRTGFGFGTRFRAETRDARLLSPSYSEFSVQRGSASATETTTSTTVAACSWRPEPELKKRHSSDWRTF